MTLTAAHQKYLAAQSKLNSMPIELDINTTAFLVIDMQEYFVNPQSPFSRNIERRTSGLGDYLQNRSKTLVEPNLKSLLDMFREKKQRVIFTTVASERPDGADWAPAFKRINLESQEQIGEPAMPAKSDRWARIVELLEPSDEELVINKTTYGAFASTGLDSTLRNLGIVTLVLGGVVTNRCVETTMRDATDRGYQVILVDDGSATFSQEIQDATTLSLQGAYGFVRQTNEILKMLEKA